MKRLVSLLVSLAILALIYWKIDARRLAGVFGGCDPVWMAVSLGMVVPLTLLTSWRLDLLMPRGTRLGFAESNKLILAASTLNMVLPSKMGDIAKAYFMRQRGHLAGSLSLALVVFEKACDMLSLLLWCAFGLMLYPEKDWLFLVMTAGVAGGLAFGLLLLGSKRVAGLFFDLACSFGGGGIRAKVARMRESWDEMHDYFWGDLGRLGMVSGASVFIWLLHLLQIWFFILALRAWTPFLANLALSPLAILAGLLPLTFAGVGTRDAALIWFYRSYFGAPVAAALGLLCTARYVLPAIGGLPFVGQFLSAVRSGQVEGREDGPAA